MAKYDKSVSDTIERIASGKRAPRKPSLLAQIKKINSFHSWRKFCKDNDLNPVWDISHRGGTLGVYSDGLIALLPTKADSSMFPSKIGVYCNYLGGGLRGSIQGGGYNEDLASKSVEIIEAFYEACRKAYLSLEQMEDEDGEVCIPDDPINTGYGRVNVKSAY